MIRLFRLRASLLRRSLSVALFAALLSSCTLSPAAPEGRERYADRAFRFRVDYPAGECEVSERAEAFGEQAVARVLSIADRGGDYLVQVVAIRAQGDSRLEYGFYPTVDTLCFDLGACVSERRNFLTDAIDRDYAPQGIVSSATRSIYGGKTVYVLLSRCNEQGRERAAAVVDSFRSPDTGGPVNFLRRKIYSLLGDNGFSAVLCYVLFSLGFTIVFWYGGCLCFTASDSWAVTLPLLLLFFAAFGYVAVHDEFMGYLHGYDNLFGLACACLLLFLDGD